MAINYSILADVELKTTNLQKQLTEKAKGLKINLDTKDAVTNTENLRNTMEDTSLTFQAANEIFSKSVEIIESMVDRVYKLDKAIVEFKKVSDLDGKSLDNYIDKLSDMGSVVARSGKPRCQAPNDGIVNQR